MPSPGTHKAGCLTGQLLPQFPSWYDPPRSAAAGIQGLSKQFNSNENFHPPFLSCNQVHRIRGRDLSPPSLPIPRHSQPVGAALGAACFTACGGKHSPLHPARVAPSAGEAQQIPQGTSGPGKLCLLLTLCMPRCQGPGRLQHPSERYVQAWAGLGRAGGPFTQP